MQNSLGMLNDLAVGQPVFQPRSVIVLLCTMRETE